MTIHLPEKDKGHIPGEKGNNLRYLIVRQRPAFHSDLTSLLQTLQNKHALDAYSARQRLVGPGLALFFRGEASESRKLLVLLQDYGYVCWQIELQPPAIIPDLLRSLKINDDRIEFFCQKGQVQLPRGAKVVGVLADLSGRLTEKHLKRVLARKTYCGDIAVDVLSHDEKIRIILQGQPVFDFYLLNSLGKVNSAVQVMPGRFNVDGLGGRASLSSKQNLLAMVALVEEYADSFQLDCDFGLCTLPKCEVQSASENSLAAMNNLTGLAHYGWLLTQIYGMSQSNVNSVVSPENTIISRSSSPEHGLLPDGAGEGGGIDLALGEIDIEESEVSNKPQTSCRKRELPPPPSCSNHSKTSKPLWKVLGGCFAGLSIAMASSGEDLIRFVPKYGMETGVIPGIAAGFLLWNGWYFLRLKRWVEDTPTSKVRSMALGFVEIHGRARRQYALVSPMSQSACVWYRLRKYKKDKRKNWKLVKQLDSNHVPFGIDDGTGYVLVNPFGATVRAKVQQVSYPGQAAMTLSNWPSTIGTDEKWVEDIIYEGTKIYVLGFAQLRKKNRKSLKERTLTKLRQLKLDQRAMHRYDTDRNGQIDQSEWQAACDDAEHQALYESLEEGVKRKRQEEHVMIAKSSHRGFPFVIAEAAIENDLTRKYALTCIPLLLAGLGAAVLAIYKVMQFIRINL